MIEWIKEMVLTPWVALLLYGLPLVVCTVGYIGRTYHNYRKDVKAREAYENRDPAKSNIGVWYTPSDTIGTLIGRAIVTILPVGNLIAAVFDVAPHMFERFFAWIDRVFDQPLVPKRK